MINELNVYRNMFLQRETVLGGPLGILDDKAMRRAAVAHLDRMGVNIPSVDAEVSRLSGGQRQAIAVAPLSLSESKDPAARRADSGDGREGIGIDPRPYPSS